MKNRFSVIIISLVLLSWGCEKIIDINLQDKERKIVVNGLMNPDSLVTVNLTKSLGILENDTFLFIDNAQVTLSLEGRQIGILQYMGAGYYHLPDFFPSPGHDYRLDVSVKGMNPAYAVSEVPDKVMIQAVDTVSFYDEWGSRTLKMSLRFTDPVDMPNYYALAVYATAKRFNYETGQYYPDKETHPVYFDRDDPFMEQSGTDYGGKLFFNDQLFTGNQKELNFQINDYSLIESDTVWLEVRLEQVTRPYYLFVLSFSKYRSTSHNPFAEPVQVYNNIKGGYGLFSGYSADSKNIVITGWGGH
ncbi:MAG: DUF4249 domain-containing protein [Bacteroidales bacterium]|nr:DUF4249 domain-containing protein [Bacteroidales bacterium]